MFQPPVIGPLQGPVLLDISINYPADPPLLHPAGQLHRAHLALLGPALRLDPPPVGIDPGDEPLAELGDQLFSLPGLFNQ